jgi:PleD family two-component response regulator
VAEYPGAVTSHQLIAAADEALYRAKRAGRDCVVRAGLEGD